jgi:hypothetical protein
VNRRGSAGISRDCLLDDGPDPAAVAGQYALRSRRRVEGGGRTTHEIADTVPVQRLWEAWAGQDGGGKGINRNGLGLMMVGGCIFLFLF